MKEVKAMDCNESNESISETQMFNILGDYFRTHGLVKHQIDTFNQYITFGIEDIILKEPDITVKQPVSSTNKNEERIYTVKFSNVYITNPTLFEENRTMKTMLPIDARNRDLTYDSPIFVDVTEITEEAGKDPEIVKHNRVIIGRTPIMLHSNKCNLSYMSQSECIENGECEWDHGGYFIIKGKERVLVGQLRSAYNKIYVMTQKNQDKFKYVAEVRSMSDETAHSVLVQAKLGNDDRTMVFSLPYIKENINIAIVFKALGFTSSEEIIKFINPTNRQFDKYIKYILRDSYFIQTTEQALQFIGQFSLHVIKEDRRALYAKQVVETELLPHLGVTATNTERALFLGQIVRKLLATAIGLRSEDDKDNYSNKRVEMAGTLCTELFRALFKRFVKTIVSQLEKKKQYPDILSLISRTNIITTGMRTSFATGNWGVQKNSYIRTGVSQVLSRLSFSGFISHLRRLVIPIGKEGKNTKIRLIHGSQIFSVCPHETPEGAGVGIVLNLAMLANISNKRSTTTIRDILETYLDKIIMPCESETFSIGYGEYTPIFLNGIPIGLSSNANQVIEVIRDLRFKNILPFDVSIAFDLTDNEIWISCDEGRFLRPLFIVENNRLKITQNDGFEFNSLIKKRLIEYLDCSEIEQKVIAMSPEDFKSFECDYCELHPSMLLGVMGLNIPFSEHTQSPRICYSASMCKQAIGMYAMSYKLRTDTITHVLDYPQKPLVSTVPSQFFGFNHMPAGINAIVAVACYTGQNQEDSIIVNKSAIERGLFCSVSYRTHMEEEKKRGTYNYEKIIVPPYDKMRKDLNYGYLDENGVIKSRGEKGSIYVKKGDVIIGKVLITTSKNGEEEQVDCSLSIKNGEEGYIDKVVQSVTPSGYKMVKVVIRTIKIPEIGDKCASRDGQKGTIGAVMPQVDMPFTSSGISPDMIINSHCLPSRMTIHQLMETVLGKSCALEGEFGNATPFSTASINISEQICDRLEKNGFERTGWETMYNGMTGEKLDAQIFIGPTYYQRLKHLVSEKCHCLTPDHEVLTSRGWVFIKNVKKTDKVAVLKDDLSIVYENPIEVLHFPNFSGQLLSINSKQISLKVTLNHKMYCSILSEDNENKFDDFKLHEAIDIHGKISKYKSSAQWNCIDYQFYLPADRHGNEARAVDMNSFLKFLGIYIVNAYADNKRVLMIINDKIKSFIIDVLSEMNCDYKQFHNSSKLIEILTTDQMRRYLCCIGNGLFPDWIWSLSARQSKLLLDSILLASEVEDVENKFYTTFQRLANDVQRLAIHAGYFATVYDDENLAQYVVTIYRNTPFECITDSSNQHIVKYTGSVYCLQVSSQVFYVRKNGKGCWTGNSRARGSVTTAFRQPLCGRSRDGGLRFGKNPFCQSKCANTLLVYGMVGDTFKLRGKPVSPWYQVIVETLSWNMLTACCKVKSHGIRSIRSQVPKPQCQGAWKRFND